MVKLTFFFLGGVMSSLADVKVEAQRRAVILDVQKFITAHADYEPVMNHYFSKNVYAREMNMKKGSIIVGKIHKFENLCILSKGAAIVISHEGRKIVQAPCTFVASPGAKRIIVALEDLTWTNVHGTSETDLAKIEEEFIAKDFNEVLTETEMKLLGEALNELDDSGNGSGGFSNQLHEPKVAGGE